MSGSDVVPFFVPLDAMAADIEDEAATAKVEEEEEDDDESLCLR